MTNSDVQSAIGVSRTNVTSPRTTRVTQLRKMLARRNGATIAQIQQAFAWQPHTARAAISSLRKAGAMVERNGTPRGTVYRITLKDLEQ